MLKCLTKLGKFLAKKEFSQIERRADFRLNKIYEFEEAIKECDKYFSLLLKERNNLLHELERMRSKAHPWEAARHHAANQTYREHVDELRHTIYRIIKNDHLLPTSAIYSEPLHELLCLQDNELQGWIDRHANNTCDQKS
jgi:hypothetical protein